MQMDENGEYDDDFPVGLKVLIVDHDLTCLLVLEAMLRKLSYQVTKCQRARDALDLLREDENRFDIVLCSLHMPGMDGLKLLKIIRAEMDLPVVMITADDGKEASMKVIINGACDYLVKPVQMQTIRFIWQHVVRKREQSKHMMADHIQQPAGSINVKDNNTMLLQQAKNAAQRMATRDKSEDGEEVENPRGYSSDEVTTGKKQRVIWSQELHEVFVAAVHQLGRSKAVPKKILERMQAIDATDLCSGLSRANVASHLQKYRLHIRKGSESSTDRNRDVHPVYEEASSFAQYNLQYHPTTAHQLQVPVRNHGGDHPSHNQVRNNMYVDSVVPELTHCLPIELPSHGANLLLQNDVVFVSNDEHCYRNVGDYVSENSNSISDVEEFIYEPSFYVRQFDQDHFFRGPFA